MFRTIPRCQCTCTYRSSAKSRTLPRRDDAPYRGISGNAPLFVKSSRCNSCGAKRDEMNIHIRSLNTKDTTDTKVVFSVSFALFVSLCLLRVAARATRAVCDVVQAELRQHLPDEGVGGRRIVLLVELDVDAERNVGPGTERYVAATWRRRSRRPAAAARDRSPRRSARSPRRRPSRLVAAGSSSTGMSRRRASDDVVLSSATTRGPGGTSRSPRRWACRPTGSSAGRSRGRSSTNRPPRLLVGRRPPRRDPGSPTATARRRASGARGS